MAMTFKTPDVYIEEVPVFPPSVAEVGTAIPAFVGYTQKAERKGEPLLQKPVKIYSFAEYQELFGGPFALQIRVAVKDVDGKPVLDTYAEGDPPAPAGGGGPAPAPPSPPPIPLPPKHFLYWSIKQYYENGGGQCYVVSVGPYKAEADAGADKAELIAGLAKIALEDEPTLLVVPEAATLRTLADYQDVCTAQLNQCGDLMDRFAILDVWNGLKAMDESIPSGGAGGDTKKLIDGNRDAWTAHLKYGAAYYPFLKTTISHAEASAPASVTVKGAGADKNLSDEKAWEKNTDAYNLVKAALKDHYITLPPSGAVAGVYAAVDGARGVWKAPANVALAGVLEPVIRIDNKKQETLNVDPTSGKSVNVLRAFAGKGTLVWGARTLAGNDNEWRYISVRRFFNTVEESVKKSTYWAVFEPNDANLWVKVRGMIENYLIDKWREGALAGALPKDAFYVKCGLGTTMSAQDVLNGRLYVEIGMAVVRPAEFIVLKFFHKLQTS